MEEFWIILVAFIAINAIVCSVISKGAGRNLAQGLVELGACLVLYLVMGDELRAYWKMFDFSYIGEFIEASVELFLGGIMFLICGIAGVVDVLRGLFGRK